jgi:hypothetical protein
MEASRPGGRWRSTLRPAFPACGRNTNTVVISPYIAQRDIRLQATSSSGSPRTAGRQSPSCAEQKSAWGHSRRRPKGRLRQLWESAPAPLRGCARHHSSCVTLRLRFNYLSRVSQLFVPHPMCFWTANFSRCGGMTNRRKACLIQLA